MAEGGSPVSAGCVDRQISCDGDGTRALALRCGAQACGKRQARQALVQCRRERSLRLEARANRGDDVRTGDGRGREAGRLERSFGAHGVEPEAASPGDRTFRGLRCKRIDVECIRRSGPACGDARRSKVTPRQPIARDGNGRRRRRDGAAGIDVQVDRAADRRIERQDGRQRLEQRRPAYRQVHRRRRGEDAHASVRAKASQCRRADELVECRGAAVVREPTFECRVDVKAPRTNRHALLPRRERSGADAVPARELDRQIPCFDAHVARGVLVAEARAADAHAPDRKPLERRSLSA